MTGPDLWELFEDGKVDDEVAAIIRLGPTHALPPNVRIVTQFGSIATVRLTRNDLPRLSTASEVLDINAGGYLLGPDLESEGAEAETSMSLEMQPSDVRRPPDEVASGRGCVCGVVDWGFDFTSSAFRNADGSTRILALWDQRGGKRKESPSPFGYGIVHDRAAIDRALAGPDPFKALSYHPADADTGIGCHGTHVASIAAGSAGENQPAGIAPEAQLVFVHSAPWDESQAGRLGDSVTLLEAIDFIARLSGDRPWVVNLSMGCHADQHDGTTLVERGLDAVVSAAPGRAVCLSVGNYYNKRIHASGQLRPTQDREFAWNVNEKSPSDYNQLQVWYSWQDRFDVELRSPDGSIVAMAKLGERARIMSGGTELGNVYHRGQDPNTLNNHINIYLYKDAPSGAWTVKLTAVDVIDGRYHAWIEREVSCPRCQSRFLPEDADPHSTTGTVCNGRRTFAVGAYDRHDPEQRIGPFSSVGPTADGRLKPDLCAPGVRVLAARSTPRENADKTPKLTRMSGTSMAAPHVTGTVALMFQASARKLRIEELHNLLLGSARRVSIPEDNPDRIGIGFLDVSAAVEAARRAGARTTGFRQITVRAPARALPLHQSASAPESVAVLAPALAGEAEEPASAPQAESVAGPCPDVDAPHRRLAQGAVDPAVREVQRKLNVYHAQAIAAGRAGLPNFPLVTDCIFGPRTAGAVRAFQGQVFAGQLREQDGIVGPHTWAALDQIPVQPPGPSPTPPPSPDPQPAAPCGTLKVWINAFIPGNVPGYTFTVAGGPHAGKSAIPCPPIALPANIHCLSRGYLTDQRTFDDRLSAGQRMRSLAEIRLAPPALLAHPGADHTTSGTTEIDKTTGAVTCVKPADMSRCAFRNFRVDPSPTAPGDYFIRLEVVASAADPCVNLAADIDYTGTITVLCSPARSQVEVSFGGLIDSFPAFEMYAQLAGATKTLFRVPPPAGNTVANLLGAAATPVSGRVTFDPCRLVPPAPGQADVLPTPGTDVIPARRRHVDHADALVADSLRLPPTRRSVHGLGESLFGHELTEPGARRPPTAAEVYNALRFPGREPLRSRMQEQFERVGGPGEYLVGQVREGDVILRSGGGGPTHVAVIGASELIPREDLHARGLSPESSASGLYAQVIEGGARPRTLADGFARQVTDSAGRVRDNQYILRPLGEAPESIDPLSLVVGLGLASTMARPAAPPPPATTTIILPEPPGSDSLSDADTASEVVGSDPCASALSAFGVQRREGDRRKGRHPRAQTVSGRPQCNGLTDLEGARFPGALDLLLWNFDIEGSYTKIQHEAALDRLILAMRRRLFGGNGTPANASTFAVAISGFASKTGSADYNVALATDREKVVQDYLQANLGKFGNATEIAERISFVPNPSGFDPDAKLGVEDPHARAVRIIASPDGKPLPPPRPFPTPEATLRGLLDASMLLTGDRTASFLVGALPTGRQRGTIWSYDMGFSDRLVATAVDCLIPHGSASHSVRVLDLVAWNGIKIKLPASDGGTAIELSFSRQFLLGSFQTTKGSITPLTHRFWRLEAVADVATAVVFAFDVTNPASPAPIDAEQLTPAPANATPAKRWVLACCELVLNQGRADFEPAGVLEAARVYPIVEVLTNFTTASTRGSVTLKRPNASSLDHPWASGGKHLPGLFVDRNEDLGLLADTAAFFGKSGGALPIWDNIFDYYDKNAAAGSRVQTVVDPSKPARSLAGKRLAIDRTSLFGGRTPTSVTKVARQGAYDNIHIAPQMVATLVGILGIPPTPVTMAPVCAHDCFHMHWRWSKAYVADSALGWGSKGPYTEAGAPLVQPQQTVRLMTAAGVAGFIYEASAPQSANDWMLVMPHGGAFALRTKFSIEEIIQRMIDRLPGPLGRMFGSGFAGKSENELFALFYFLIQFWPLVSGGVVDVLEFNRKVDLETL